MPTRTDKTTLPEARVCEICGVTQQYRRTLVMRNLLRKAPKGGCTLRDALELITVRVMSDAMGALDTTAAVMQLDAAFADSLPAGRFDLIYDVQQKLLSVARDEATLRELVAHGRPVRVFALGEQFAQTGDAFRRTAAAVKASRRRSSSSATGTGTGTGRRAASPKRPLGDGGA